MPVPKGKKPKRLAVLESDSMIDTIDQLAAMAGDLNGVIGKQVRVIEKAAGRTPRPVHQAVLQDVKKARRRAADMKYDLERAASNLRGERGAV